MAGSAPPQVVPGPRLLDRQRRHLRSTASSEPSDCPTLLARVTGLRPENRHPVVLVDPRPESHLAVTRLQQRGITVHVLTSRRLEPASFSRNVGRHSLPPMTQAPQRWEARLLELAALLEPRPILLPCSRDAALLLGKLDTRLSPHYACAHLQTLMPDGLRNAPTAEAALRRVVLRGEPALEIQLVIDRHQRCIARCALTWSAGARPDVIVASVDAPELVERSLHWLRSRRLVGYARLIWAPDRTGHMVNHACSILPGLGWALALQDGVDFPLQWYAALVGTATTAQTATRSLSRRLSIAEPGTDDDRLPLCAYAPAWCWRDPLPWVAGVLGSLVRR